MKILTLGDGFIAKHLPYEKVSEKIAPLTIRSMLESYKPDVIVNCIGKTGKPNIDWCESNKIETYWANVMLPCMLARECERVGIHMIHIGSGCIYSGVSPHAKYVHTYEKVKRKPFNITHEKWEEIYDYKKDEWTWTEFGWKENDFANPQSYYSKTKYACDLAIGSLSNITILRIRMPVSPKDDSRNFINKVRGYSQVIDIPNSMTLMQDLTRCIEWVSKNHIMGIYHVTNPQPITAAQVMREFQKYRKDHKFEVINEAQLDELTAAKRSNCILNTDKLNNAGFYMTPSQEALEQCMAEYIKNI